MKHLSIKLLLVVLFWGMAFTGHVNAAGGLSVFASILPQRYFIEKVGGDLVDVLVMVRPGANPATFEPKPQQMVALSRARIYFAVGVPFENAWLVKFAAVNPNMLIVHTEEGIEKINMKVRRHQGDEKHDAKEKHGIKDPHVWLSPPLAKTLARNILTALISVDPAHRSIYETNYRRLILEVDELDTEIREVFSNKKRVPAFLVFHPSWGYFARTYGLEQIPVEIEGKEPKPAELYHLIALAKKRGIKVVFVQPQFSSKSAKIIANAISGEISFVDPLAEDWAMNLREVVKRLKETLR